MLAVKTLNSSRRSLLAMVDGASLAKAAIQSLFSAKSAFPVAQKKLAILNSSRHHI
jgi:hypothetical protein